MARPRKFPTIPVRLNKALVLEYKIKAKKKGMSFPDYLAWRLSQ